MDCVREPAQLPSTIASNKGVVARSWHLRRYVEIPDQPPGNIGPLPAVRHPKPTDWSPQKSRLPIGARKSGITEPAFRRLRAMGNHGLGRRLNRLACLMELRRLGPGMIPMPVRQSLSQLNRLGCKAMAIPALTCARFLAGRGGDVSIWGGSGSCRVMSSLPLLGPGLRWCTWPAPEAEALDDNHGATTAWA